MPRRGAKEAAGWLPGCPGEGRHRVCFALSPAPHLPASEMEEEEEGALHPFLGDTACWPGPGAVRAMLGLLLKIEGGAVQGVMLQ